MLRLLFVVLPLLSVLACGSAADIDGEWTLRTVAGKSPRDSAFAAFCELPSESTYRFQGRSWTSVHKYNSRSRCNEDAVAHLAEVDSGAFRVAGDTIHLMDRDTTQGVRGWVGYFIRHSRDTLITWGSEFDPGASIYVRSKS